MLWAGDPRSSAEVAGPQPSHHRGCRLRASPGTERKTAMPLPEMDETSRKRPLCYDPDGETFLYYDDMVSGKAPIVPVDELSEDELKKLVIARWRVLPEDTTTQSISGPPLRRDDVIRAIERDEPFGRITLQAERSYLVRLLEDIEGQRNRGALAGQRASSRRRRTPGPPPRCPEW